MITLMRILTFFLFACAAIAMGLVAYGIYATTGLIALPIGVLVFLEAWILFMFLACLEFMYN